jgi:gluconolactonase
VTVIADAYQGKKLNSPNDAVVAHDGAIWFTDATYGIDSDYEGVAGESELGARHVFRIDPSSGEVQSMADDFQQPTGIGFSPDGTRLYVADSRANHLRAFDVKDDGGRPRLTGGDVLDAANGKPGVAFDSLDVDVNGRVWVAAGWDGVRCYDPDGTLIGRVFTPECASNCVFGGKKRTRLFITASTSVYSITLGFGGVPRAYDAR